MKRSSPLPSGPQASRSLFRLSPVAAGATVMLMSMAAHAQTTTGPSTQPAPAADAPQTITVTGIRRGIENAINVKKGSDSIVEAVSAEDIGKLPDSSIAESIARLPGLAAQTVNGRAKEVSIRGLSGQFANTLLNGREQTSTNNNRSVEFDQYPSELLSAVLVYKTPDASLMGQGIAGTIDLQTVRPLSFGQRTFAINVRGEKNGKGTPFPGDGSRFNLAYIDQFADRTVGIALGFARLKQDTEKVRTETYDTTTTACLNADTTVSGGACSGAGTTFVHNQGFKYFVDKNEETRDGAMAVLEFKPNKNLSSVVDVFYSKFEKEFVKRGLEIQVNDNWKNSNPDVGYQAPRLTNAVFGASGELQSGVWGNVNPLSRHLWEPREDELNSLGWNTKWKFADKWQAALDLSYSSAKSTNRVTEMEAGQYDTVNNRPLPEDVTVANYNQIASLQYDRSNLGTMRLTDPESWGQNGYDKIIKTDDKLKALRLSAQRELEGLFSRVDFGVNYTKRDKEKGSAEAFLRLPDRCTDVGDPTATPPRAPAPAGCNPAIRNPGGALPSGTLPLGIPGSGLTTIAFDPSAALASYRFDPNVNSDILRKGWTVNEKVTTLFAKADLETQVFGLPMRGNVGVQVVRSDQSSTAPVVGTTSGNQSVATFETRTDGKTYTDFLPTANLIFDLSNDQIVRVGAGRQMARPRMDDLTAFSRTEVNNSNLWEGNGGNPKLNPYRANAFDVSYEKYFGTKGYVSAAAFYKDLKSWILRLPQEFDFTGQPNLSNRVATSPIGFFTLPQNLTGGKLSGFELAVSLPLNLVTPVLDGFGVQGSFARTNSSIKPFPTGGKYQIPGFSREVTTLTAYYEKYGFSARIATRDRAPYIAEVEGFGGDREFPSVRREQITDLQLGYELQSGIAKGLTFLLQVNNLDNEPYVEYNPNTNLDTKVDRYGRTYLFGVTYKF